MPYLTLEEINTNPIYQPPAEWKEPSLLEQIETFNKEKLNNISTIPNFWNKKYTDFFTGKHWVYYTTHNEFKKFTYVNLPLGSGHKGWGADSNRFSDNFPGCHREHYQERLSLLKSHLYEWCKLNNLKVNKSTSAKKMIKLLWEMENN